MICRCLCVLPLKGVFESECARNIFITNDALGAMRHENVDRMVLCIMPLVALEVGTVERNVTFISFARGQEWPDK